MRGDGAVYLRGDTWWLRFSADGKEYRMSAETTNKTRAKERLREELAKYRTGTFVEPELRKVRISELFNDLMAHYELQGKTEYATACKARWQHHLEPFFGRIVAAQLGTTLQREYQLKRKAEGAASASINKEIMILSAAFHLAHKSEPPRIVRLPRMLLFKEDNARKVFVTDEQWAAILKASTRDGLDFRVFLELAWVLGWRRGEILRLRVQDIDLVAGSIRLQTSKNGEPREVPITPGLLVFLEQLIVGRKPEDLLIGYKARGIQFRWERAVKAAGFPHLHIHDIRRTSARTKRARGVSESVIMDLQGWRTSGMFRRYAITDRGDKMAALMAMENRTDVAQKQPTLEEVVASKALPS